MAIHKSSFTLEMNALTSNGQSLQYQVNHPAHNGGCDFLVTLFDDAFRQFNLSYRIDRMDLKDQVLFFPTILLTQVLPHNNQLQFVFIKTRSGDSMTVRIKKDAEVLFFGVINMTNDRLIRRGE